MPIALADDKVALWLDLCQESPLDESFLLDLKEFTVRPMDRAMNNVSEKNLSAIDPGATVIATAAANNHDFLRQLGAHEVIDYAKVRFEDKVSDVNVVFDTIGGDTLERSYGVLRQGGTLVSIVEPPSAENAKAQGIKGEFFIVEPNRTQLEEIGRLIDTGCLYAFVDTVLPLEQAPQAFEQGLKGHSRGKIVLRIAG
jgi:NADPH:quinone reductase-like Zn-dependent oxidoreductase